nr:hypothetical protein Ade03nite_39580 [Actinoplanes derwentensis]
MRGEQFRGPRGEDVGERAQHSDDDSQTFAATVQPSLVLDTGEESIDIHRESFLNLYDRPGCALAFGAETAKRRTSPEPGSEYRYRTLLPVFPGD